jgi:hypothetical protein
VYEGRDGADAGHGRGSEWAVLYRIVTIELAPLACPVFDWGLDMACRCVPLMAMPRSSLNDGAEKS